VELFVIILALHPTAAKSDNSGAQIMNLHEKDGDALRDHSMPSALVIIRPPEPVLATATNMNN
jgi:hypothetical protein